MVVRCSECGARYNFIDGIIPGRLNCTRCDYDIEIKAYKKDYIERSEDHIDETLSDIKNIWMSGENREMRLYQLLYNILKMNGLDDGFYIEDNEWLNLFNNI